MYSVLMSNFSFHYFDEFYVITFVYFNIKNFNYISDKDILSRV